MTGHVLSDPSQGSLCFSGGGTQLSPFFSRWGSPEGGADQSSMCLWRYKVGIP